MNIIDTEFEGLKLFKSPKFKDERGLFFESYSLSALSKAGINDHFSQDNVSVSKKGTLRGMHGQMSPSQSKFVRCLSGRIIDSVVDIRPQSKTFLKTYSVELLGEDDFSTALFVPHGFLHGFLSLEENTIVSYKVTGLYNKSGEYSTHPLECGVHWYGYGIEEFIISEKDTNNPKIDDFIKSDIFINQIQKTF